jgi:hypothetical protein
VRLRAGAEPGRVDGVAGTPGISAARRELLIAVGAGDVSGFSINGGIREVWVDRGSLDNRVVTARVAAAVADGLIDRVADPAGSSSRWGWRLTPAGRAALRAARPRS